VVCHADSWIHCVHGLLGCHLKLQITVFAAISALLIHQVFLGEFPLIDSYLDPFLSMPIMIGLPILGVRLWDKNFKIKPSLAWGFALTVAVIFEYWIPRFDPRFTADLIDAPFYLLGTGWLMLAQRQ
jgi:hypothetical protein